MEELSRCPLLEIKHYMWNSKQRPKTFGRMGYLFGRGLYVELTCMERAPKRECLRHRDMVCRDSAMEAFFAFPDTGKPDANSLYFNFEVNANGALYAKHGRGRNGRQFITEEEMALTGVNAVVEPESWTARFLLPRQTLERVAGIGELPAGYVFYFNLYKISEDPAIEHYAAYSPIPVEAPNFHLPQYFAGAVIADSPNGWTSSYTA